MLLGPVVSLWVTGSGGGVPRWTTGIDASSKFVSPSSLFPVVDNSSVGDGDDGIVVSVHSYPFSSSSTCGGSVVLSCHRPL